MATAPETSSAQQLLYRVEGGIGTVTFNRPRARNALTFSMYERLREICRAAADDAAVKVLVLTGAGGQAFAAGTDIAQFRDFNSAADALEYERFMDSVLARISHQMDAPSLVLCLHSEFYSVGNTGSIPLLRKIPCGAKFLRDHHAHW